MHRRVFASLVLAGLLPVSAPSPAAGEVEWLALDSARQHRVSEPVHGGQVVVYEAGSRRKPTVVLIHGLGQNGARDWAEVIPTLVADYHVLAVDQPGFGASDQANRLYSPDNQARAIHAALEAFAPDSFVLVGHSMGAAVSLAFAEFYPRRVRRLVLVDMAGVLQRSAYAEFLSRLGAQYFTGLRPGDDSWFGGVVRGVLRQAERMPVDFGMVLQSEWMRERFLGANPNAIAAYALVERDFSAALRGISVPTLLIWGADDPVAPLVDPYLAHLMRAGAQPKQNFTSLRELFGPGVDAVTVRQLLAMESGIPDFDTAKPWPKPLDPLRAALYARPGQGTISLNYLKLIIYKLPYR